jgi:hypothetical protein
LDIGIVVAELPDGRLGAPPLGEGIKC